MSSLSESVGGWFRRHRLKLAIGGGLFLAAAIVAAIGLWRIFAAEKLAKDRRATAEAHRADAEELLGSTLADMRGKLEPLGRAELLADAAKRTRDYLDKHPPGDLPAEQHQRAILLCGLASAQHAAGDGPGAVLTYRAGHAMLEPIVALPTVRAEWRDALATCRADLAGALADQNDVAAARQNLDAALAIWTELAAAEPAADAWQVSLARVRDQLGSLSRRQGEVDAAFEHYTVAFGHAEKAKAAPRLTAGIRGNIGKILLARKDYKGALAQFGASLGLFEELAKADPRDLGLQRELASIHDMLATTRQSSGDNKSALKEARAELAILERLAAMDPNDTALQYEVGNTRANVGKIELATGDARGALEQHQAALAVFEKLFAKDPANADWAGAVAFSRLSNAAALAKLGDGEGAHRMLTAADAAHASLPPARRNEKAWAEAVATLTEQIAKIGAKGGKRR